MWFKLVEYNGSIMAWHNARGAGFTRAFTVPPAVLELAITQCP